MRKLSLVIAGILGAGSPLISQAATLGQAQVQSYLSEPLEVRVPLMRSSDEPLDEITVQLAPPSFYREAGVPLANLTGNLTFAIESEGGQDYVLVGSKRPIRDPIISLLLQVQSPQGRMIRSYNLLLDPPTTASSATKAEQPIAQREPSRAAPTPAPSAPSEWQRVEPAENLSLESSRTVERGDTLSEIASDYVGEGENVRSVMQAIIDANPHAFANGNGNTMLAGAELKVPTARGETGQSDASGTEGEVASQGPALELLSPSEGEQRESASLGGLGELSRDKPLPAIAAGEQPPAQSMDREGALAQEELESVKAENEALTEQLRSLKEEIDSVKVAVDERDTRIADLKEVVEESRQQVEQAKARQDNFWVQWGMYLTGGMGLLIIALLIALGLRRSRRDDEPAVPMPTTADAAQAPHTDAPSAERDTTGAVAASAATAAAAAGAVSAGDQDSVETAATEPTVDDPMNPDMALEEARVLESFNLTHQALELLQESLAEHPGHAGLQAAINRLSGIEQEQVDTEEGVEEAGRVDSMTEEDVTVSGETDQLESADEAPQESSVETESRDTGWQAEDEAVAESPSEQPEPSGEIAWDEDFDDMLATPDTDTAPDTDDNLMEFDDSFALETPNEEQGTAEKQQGASAESDDTLLDLSDDEASMGGDEGEAEQSAPANEPDALDLDLSGYEPAGEAADSAGTTEDEGLDLDMTPEAEEERSSGPAAETSGSEADSEADVDTRVSLAEAFLDVGDRESFEMIEAELREEGATSALQRLDELKQRYES